MKKKFNRKTDFVYRLMAWIQGFALLFDGFIAVITFGLIRPWLSCIWSSKMVIYCTKQYNRR